MKTYWKCTSERSCDYCGYSLIFHALQRTCPGSEEEARHNAKENFLYAKSGVFHEYKEL